jgi:hypothetical protein
MSTRQTGNARENRVIDKLEQLGYCCYASRGSRGTDIIALHEQYGWPHLCVAVMRPIGGNIATEFAKLRAKTLPAGAVCIVAREITSKIHRWYARPDHRGGHLIPQLAIDEARQL